MTVLQFQEQLNIKIKLMIKTKFFMILQILFTQIIGGLMKC